jgi:hypothetical protein
VARQTDRGGRKKIEEFPRKSGISQQGARSHEPETRRQGGIVNPSPESQNFTNRRGRIWFMDPIDRLDQAIPRQNPSKPWNSQRSSRTPRNSVRIRTRTPAATRAEPEPLEKSNNASKQHHHHQREQGSSTWRLRAHLLDVALREVVDLLTERRHAGERPRARLPQLHEQRVLPGSSAAPATCAPPNKQTQITTKTNTSRYESQHPPPTQHARAHLRLRRLRRRPPSDLSCTCPHAQFPPPPSCSLPALCDPGGGGRRFK